MPKDPAVLFYTSDFLGGTLLFTYEQKGQYIDLLCLQREIYPDHIPLDRMIIVCSSYDNPVFKKFTMDSDKKYYNERMEYEIKKRISYCESRRLASNARFTKNNHTTDHTIDHTIHRTRNRNRNSNANKERKKIKYPLLDEVKKYFAENGYRGAERFYGGYAENDWCDSNGKKIISWKMKAQQVWFTEENKLFVKKDDKKEYHIDIPVEDLPDNDFLNDFAKNNPIVKNIFTNKQDKSSEPSKICDIFK